MLQLGAMASMAKLVSAPPKRLWNTYLQRLNACRGRCRGLSAARAQLAAGQGVRKSVVGAAAGFVCVLAQARGSCAPTRARRRVCVD